MRTEYVIPLLGKLSARLEQFEDDIAKSTSTAHRKKLEKESEKFAKQRTELHSFDERPRHYADLRISLDLDEGVKVNYGKLSDPEFGDILAEVTSICGTKDENLTECNTQMAEFKNLLSRISWQTAKRFHVF